MFPPTDPLERDLVRAAVAGPADLTTWLIYADWLEDHDRHDRAEFLRLQVRLGELPADDPDRPAADARVRELRPALPPDWAAFFDRPPVENCRLQFAFECPKKWEDLATTDDLGVRHCGACDRPVYYCREVDEAREHAWQGRCVAVSLAAVRRPGDLTPIAPEPRMHRTVGIPLPRDG